MTCRELAERAATAGIDALGDRERRHLRECLDCSAYVESIAVTVRSLGELPPEPADPAVRDRLLAAFRALRV